MKKILILVALTLSFVNSEAQSAFGGYGHQPTLYRQTTTKNGAGTVKLAGLDTLTATDTGYVQFNMPNDYSMTIELFVTSLTGTLAGTSVLQGSSASTMPTVTSTNWDILTGNTTYCAGCKGASATLTGSGTTRYKWEIPKGQVGDQQYQVRSIVTGTCTATYTLLVSYKN